jgi:hypothetical protein
MTIKKPDYFNAWVEPKSAANTDYGVNSLPINSFNNVTQTPSGHAFELDDTPNRERVRLQHRSNTFIEMHPNGDEVHKIYGDGYEITIKDKNLLVNGNINITVNGDATIYTQGNVIEQIDGDYELHVKGNYSTIVEGLTSFVSQGDMDIKAGNGVDSGINLVPGHYVNVLGDIRAEGSITGSYIFSSGKVDCLDGMYAQKGGFVTTLGGISVGTGVPFPGQISSVSSITSLTSMSAPLSSSAISTSFFAKDVINGILRNLQVHIAPLGPTSPPTKPEVTA